MSGETFESVQKMADEIRREAQKARRHTESVLIVGDAPRVPGLPTFHGPQFGVPKVDCLKLLERLDEVFSRGGGPAWIEVRDMMHKQIGYGIEEFRAAVNRSS